MADLATRLDLYAIGRDYVLQRAKKLDPRQVDVAGSNANVYVGVAAVIGAAILDQLAENIAKLLLDAITDDADLDRYALDRYNLTRKGASAALGAVRFYRPTFAAGAGHIDVGTLLKTAAGIEYITTSQATFGATDLQATADVRAVQAGKSTQVGANYIRAFANAASIFDRSIQLTNDSPTAGGEDAEDLDTYKSRIRNFWTTARRGTLGAIAFGAMTVPGVVSAYATEALTDGATPARVVNLYIADSSGLATAQLGLRVQAALEDYRAGGIAVIIHLSQPQLVSVAVVAQFTAGTDTAGLTVNIRAAIVEFVNTLPVNGVLAAMDLSALLRRFGDSGLVPAGSFIAAPAGDLVPDIGQTIRTTLGLVTINGQ